MRILVAGIGNIFLGDDAFGSEVARRLLARPWPAGVQVTDFGIRGFDLTFALLEGFDAVILVDAVPRGGSPGTLYTIEPDLSGLDTAGLEATVETHAMNPKRVLAVARSMGARLERVFLVGCEPSPGTVDPAGEGSMELSDPVRGALEEAVHVVEELVENLVREAPREHRSASG
jgi:hydrogenase maturation protease